MSLYSAGVEYGIHCLIFLVGNHGDTREASVRDLAELQGVPLDYLAKIFTRLAKAKLVVATEGVRGGFKLARPADEISVLDIVNAIDGQKLIFDCREIRGRCALFEGAHARLGGGRSLRGPCGDDDGAETHGRSPRPADHPGSGAQGRAQSPAGIRRASGALDERSSGKEKRCKRSGKRRHPHPGERDPRLNPTNSLARPGAAPRI